MTFLLLAAISSFFDRIRASGLMLQPCFNFNWLDLVRITTHASNSYDTAMPCPNASISLLSSFHSLFLKFKFWSTARGIAYLRRFLNLYFYLLCYLLFKIIVISNCITGILELAFIYLQKTTILKLSMACLIYQTWALQKINSIKLNLLLNTLKVFYIASHDIVDIKQCIQLTCIDR